MAVNCVVLIKQVPDTKNVTTVAMKDDGTVNRAALPTIFNPDDLHALELALSIKDATGGKVTVITMGPPAACEALRDALYRGADEVVLVTDRRCAASDTLATSYILSCAVRRVGDYDLVLCGRQAIDGDTAQVGPQTAEKLNLAQITYVQKIEEMRDGVARCRRDTDSGYEVVEGRLPLLMTVVGSANEPRPPAAKRVMKYKRALSRLEIEAQFRKQNPNASNEEVLTHVDRRCEELEAKGLLIQVWNLDDIKADLAWCGRDGSPTKVKRIQAIILKASGFKKIEPTDEGVSGLIHELIQDHTIG